jgi:transposase
MRFVPIKTDEQLDLQALHRVRDRLVSRRTSVINQVRAFLLERGITFQQGRAYLREQIPELLGVAEQKLSPRMRQLVDRLWQEWKALEEQIEALSRSAATHPPRLLRELQLKAARRVFKWGDLLLDRTASSARTPAETAAATRAPG